MQTNLVILAILFSTTFCLAGTPDEDLIVKERRERFIQARIPTLDDLKLGKTWRCIIYDSFPGSFDRSEPTDAFKFSEFDGQITSEIQVRYRVHEFQLTPKYFSDSITMRLPKTNYRAVYSRLYFKVSSNGDLIFESTFDDDIPFLYGSSRSISDNTKLVAQYGVCPANKIKD